ncbi:FAD-dependent oxidoreductase [Cyclobacterium marinum]|uniref:HI0933 family protein n=1 Tax=Cyclobacterium marinum (strain ATCC 25205 / DSM 745 / LMG 13164 / NCIMB 1802) TaxID=880070 RepID=G0J475_CYCMS|nr:FAD-dependent oxidoreductase [Cyclobacterium marinum]AEL27501.1 HI0933 family protein [Cyclobacterium marinum DSM 745]
MNRRKFLNISIPATGAIMVGPGIMNLKAKSEIYRQFSGSSNFDTYDVVVNGGGFAGYFAASEAAKLGKKVLLIEKRTSPGFELFAKHKLWMEADGFEDFSPELSNLFLPEGEVAEMNNSLGTGPGNSKFEDEILLFSGSIRKGMLRNLLVSKVHVLLMTDVCGIFQDKGKVKGVLMAGKQGLQHVKCNNFIDASDQVMFSRNFFNQAYEIDRAGFVLELKNVENPQKKVLSVSRDYKVYQDQIALHRGKLSEDQAFLDFEFKVEEQSLELIEHQSRHKAALLGQNFKNIDPSLKNAEIYQHGLETSIILIDDRLPEVDFEGYFMLNGKAVTSKNIQAINEEARKMVESLPKSPRKAKASTLRIHNAEIPLDQIRFTGLDEASFSIPLEQVSFDYIALVKDKEYCQVAVAGGGTGGSFVAKGAAGKGANTIVADYFNDLGGTKTMGGVMGYYHGVTSNGFFKKQNEEAERTAFENNMSTKVGRKYYHLKEILNAGGRFIPGAIFCGALLEDQKVSGFLVCRNGKLQTINGDVTVDATGDGDIASFAGASFSQGNSRTGETQNYSQWDVKGAVSISSSPTNRDYDVLDTTKISELQRGLFLSHYEAHFYDFHPFLTVRESRLIEGMHVLNLYDVAEKTHFKDVIALASSDFDPHNVGSSEFSKCGFLLPHSNDLTVEIPYRCIVPKSLDGLLIAGRGISQTHNAMQFTRMTADILVLGYLTGQIAADLAWTNTRPRDFDVSDLQREWADLGYLPKDYDRPSNEDKRFQEDEINTRIAELSEGKREFLYECSRLPKEKAIPVLKTYYGKSEDEKAKLLLAKALAWFGESDGNVLIEEELQEMFDQEQKEGYPGGYVDNYDFIRGREKNVLEGLFWRINQNIALLAMTGSKSSIPVIRNIIENTTSGGGVVNRTNDYFNGRIDLKIIPFYNRIHNLCFYGDRIPDAQFIPGFEKLLKDENIGGFKTEDYDEVRWRVYGGLLEISIAATLARCGAKSGYLLLVSYLQDIHSNYKAFARAELRDITHQDFGVNPLKWRRFLAEKQYPRPTRNLEKTIEV